MLRSVSSAVFLVLIFGTGAPALRAQNQEPPAAEHPDDEQYFSGIVTVYGGTKLTVDRTVLGTNSTKRNFIISPSTRIDGKLRVKVRVTVQYVTKEEVDYAVHIIVRSDPPKPKK